MAEPSTGSLYALSERVTLWLARAGAGGLALMMFLTLFDVIGRTLGHPIVGSVEMTELIMGMMIYLAIGYTTFLRGHIRVDILIMQFSPRWQAFLDLITVSIAILFAALVSWRLLILAGSRVTNNDVTQIYEFPIWPSAFVMAIASILMFTSLLHQFYLAVGVLTGQAGGPPASESPAAASGD